VQKQTKIIVGFPSPLRLLCTVIHLLVSSICHVRLLPTKRSYRQVLIVLTTSWMKQAPPSNQHNKLRAYTRTHAVLKRDDRLSFPW